MKKRSARATIVRSMLFVFHVVLVGINVALLPVALLRKARSDKKDD